ncbi:MAG: hypothetical protein IJA37_05460 [Alistipes sp.]|nr:hypothetical protein [Alistipes sp.]
MDLNKLSYKILEILNRDAQNIVSVNSMSSPRSIGDAVQEFLAQKGLAEALSEIGISHIDSDFSRRSMEDIAFDDNRGNYYAVDVKTHNLSTQFNMPNLISVRRIANFYRNDSNTFCILIVSYNVVDNKLEYGECYFKPIEAFSWDCLTLGALGWGQIQIANAKTLIFEENVNRKQWMLNMCDKLEIFYNEEIGKIAERKDWFNKIRQEWVSK